MTQAARSQGPSPRIPLVWNLESRAGSTSKDAQICNAFVELQPKVEVYRRPIMTVNKTASATPGQGIIRNNSKIFVVEGGALYDKT